MKTALFMLPLAEVERRHILTTLMYCQGNRTHTAEILEISLRGLRLKLRHYEKSGFYVCRPLVRAQNQDFTVKEIDARPPQSFVHRSPGKIPATWGKLTKEREIDPYLWVHPDEERSASGGNDSLTIVDAASGIAA